MFGNGNLFTCEDGVNMLNQTGCMGLSVGRMAVARPWLFAEWSDGFTPPEDIYHTTAVRMTRLLETHYNEFFSVKLFKKFSPYFCANFKFGHDILKTLSRAQTMEEIRDALEIIFSSSPATLS